MPLLLMLLALLSFASSAKAASCVVVPGSIPAGSVELNAVLHKAAATLEKPENLEVAVFGLG